MTYTAVTRTAFRSKAGSRSDKLAYEFDLIDTELDSIQTTMDKLKVASGVLAAGNANAFAFAWQNPESTAILVHRVLINLTAAGGTGSSVINVGTGATATTASDNLIDGPDINTTNLFDNITDKGSNGKSKQKMDAMGGTTDYVTGQILVANAASLAGKYYIFYTPV